MKEATWKYAHKKQVLMDLTFGFCSAHSLLLILLAFRDNGEGISIAFIIFTAQDSAKAVHADYNTAVLTRLLGIYKDTMGLNSLGESLIFAVSNTDNDPRERSALTTHWPDISLLLCIFHIWQAWRNKLNRSLAPILKGTDCQSVCSWLGKFLLTLLKDISEYNEARKLYHEEVEYWTKLGKKRDKLAKTQSQAALGFLTYLDSYIDTREYWHSWSPAGAMDAAYQLKIPVSKIARTNNCYDYSFSILSNRDLVVILSDLWWC